MRHRPLPPPTVTFDENYDELISSWSHPRVKDLFVQMFGSLPSHLENYPDRIVLEASIFGKASRVYLVPIRPPAGIGPQRILLLFSADVDKALPGWQSVDFPAADFVGIFDLGTTRLRLYNYRALHAAFHENVKDWLDRYGRVIAEIRVGETIYCRLAFIPVPQTTFTNAFMLESGKQMKEPKESKVEIKDDEDLTRPL